jgi:hypothetical protein
MLFVTGLKLKLDKRRRTPAVAILENLPRIGKREHRSAITNIGASCARRGTAHTRVEWVASREERGQPRVLSLV